MKIAVRYYSKGGNTKKLACAIADTLGVDAQTVDTPISEETEILFLGSSVYAGSPDPKISNFIKGLDAGLVHKVCNFSTSASGKSSFETIKELLDKKGIALDTKQFSCRGSFLFMNRGKPSDEDLQDAKAFALEAVK